MRRGPKGSIRGWSTRSAVAASRRSTPTRRRPSNRCAPAATCAVTPTASGKTLCYNLPVIDAVARDDAARALSLPHQGAGRRPAGGAARAGGGGRHQPQDPYLRRRHADRHPQRRWSAGQVAITNPDMLHSAILPHHTKWFKLFENLQFVVIDELHTYRGAVRQPRRQRDPPPAASAATTARIPVFICASATIANPGELAERLLEAPVDVIDESGAPRGRKHILVVNPPVANPQLGIRGSALLTGQLAERLIGGGVQTIAFARSRTQVEVLTSYLQETFEPPPGHPHTIRGYRGGYLPNQRHEIEAGLRDGRVRGVVATNALELGSTSAASTPPSASATPAPSPRPGSRWGARADDRAPAWPRWSAHRPRSTSSWPPTRVPVRQLAGARPGQPGQPARPAQSPARRELRAAGARHRAVRDRGDALLDVLEEDGYLRHADDDRYYWSHDNFPASDFSLLGGAGERCHRRHHRRPAPRAGRGRPRRPCWCTRRRSTSTRACSTTSTPGLGRAQGVRHPHRRRLLHRCRPGHHAQGAGGLRRGR